jgi:hypothetical protein
MAHGGGGGGGGTRVSGSSAGVSAAPPAAAPGGAVDPLASLRAHPQLNAFKSIMRSNPDAMPGLLATIGQTAPDTLAVIEANRAAFVALLNEPIVGDGGGDDGDDDDGEGDEEGDDEEGGDEGDIADMLAALGFNLHHHEDGMPYAQDTSTGDLRISNQWRGGTEKYRYFSCAGDRSPFGGWSAFSDAVDEKYRRSQ